MNIKAITYINLDHRQDKLRYVRRLLKNIPITSFKTKGVLVESPTDYPVVDGVKPESKMHKGIVGCFLAHKSAIKNLIEFAQKNELESNDVVMVVEDDVRINPEFWDHVKSLECPADSDIVFFDICPKPGLQRHRPSLNNEHLIDENSNLYYVYGNYPAFYGAYAYVVMVKNLKKIFDSLEEIKVYQNVDQFYYDIFKCYTFCTNMVWFKMKFTSDRV